MFFLHDTLENRSITQAWLHQDNTSVHFLTWVYSSKEECTILQYNLIDDHMLQKSKVFGAQSELVSTTSNFTIFFYLLDFTTLGNFMYTEFLVPFLLIGVILLIPLLSVVLVVLDKNELYGRKNNLLSRRTFPN